MDRYAANISMNIPFPNEIRRKVGVDDDELSRPEHPPDAIFDRPRK